MYRPLTTRRLRLTRHTVRDDRELSRRHLRPRVALLIALFAVAIGMEATAVAGASIPLVVSPSGYLSGPPPGGDRPIVLQPAGAPAPAGGVVPFATPGVSYSCRNAGTLRRRANSYVLGWCTQGMHIDISSTVITQGWQGGYGEGWYAHCGWFLLQNGLDAGGVWDHNCGNTTYAESDFATKVNVTPTDDGTPVTIQRSDCHIWRNIKPWQTSAEPSTWYNVLDPTTDEFRWRYRSKSGMVLGHWLRNGGDTYYNWGFVDSTCVAAPPSSNLRDPSTTVPAP